VHVPLHAKIVILCFVAISVATTFMTVRQSTKRGMTPQMTPDNPMAASQKYMTYIVPFFALSGLYWAFGLVLYWVTTNVWTLGQQYVLFKRYPPTAPAAATSPGVSAKPATAAGLVAGGKPSAPRSAADAVKRPPQAKPGAKAPAAKQPAAKAPAAKQPAAKAPAAKAAPAADAAKRQAAYQEAASREPLPAPTKPATAAKPAGGGKPGATKPAPAKPSGTSGQRQGKKTGTGAATGSTAPGRQAGKQEPAANGSGSGSVPSILRRFGKGKTETAEEPQAPDVKLVRQQRVRQSRSKRSGKR
jgi:hypothetical protein